jgi:hypothetical protein
MISGETAYQDQTHAQIVCLVALKQHKLKHVPAAPLLSDVCQQAMSYDPSERPTFAELVVELERYLASRSASPCIQAAHCAHQAAAGRQYSANASRQTPQAATATDSQHCVDIQQVDALAWTSQDDPSSRGGLEPSVYSSYDQHEYVLCTGFQMPGIHADACCTSSTFNSSSVAAASPQTDLAQSAWLLSFSDGNVEAAYQWWYANKVFKRDLCSLLFTAVAYACCLLWQGVLHSSPWSPVVLLPPLVTLVIMSIAANWYKTHRSTVLSTVYLLHSLLVMPLVCRHLDQQYHRSAASRVLAFSRVVGGENLIWAALAYLLPFSKLLPVHGAAMAVFGANAPYNCQRLGVSAGTCFSANAVILLVFGLLLPLVLVRRLCSSYRRDFCRQQQRQQLSVKGKQA